MSLVESWGGNPLGWFFANLIEAFYNFFYALSHPFIWLDWVVWTGTPEDKQSLVRFIYYGASSEFFFVVLVGFLILSLVGFLNNRVMWAVVRGLETIANTVGRTFAWAGLLMVIIQILIIFLQRVFAVSEITFGFGMAFTFDVSWWSESLKFYNAMIVCLCVTWTFVQGGHVRVDLIYARVNYRTKRMIDMVGSLLFMMPTSIVVWLFGWFFLWRNLVVPNPSASNTLDQLLQKSVALRWNVETIGFSPNGFNAYFLFKVLLLSYVFLVLLQAVAFFYRSYLERKEGEVSEGRYLDRDSMGDDSAAVATH